MKIEVVRSDPGKVMLCLIGDDDDERNVSRPLSEGILK